MKKILSLALALSAVLSQTVAGAASVPEQPMLEALLHEMAVDASEAVTEISDSETARDIEWRSIADTLPAKYDLRTTGYVPEIRDQKNWGTCWGFASIAASEISILSKLGMTAQEFQEKYGEEMDLSEKALAWFATTYFPTPEEADPYPYPGNESQAGEGLHFLEEYAGQYSSHYNNGGYMGYASSIFANGMGPVSEEFIPYKAADGSDSTAVDWSLEEELRFYSDFLLCESSMLPCPSQRDKDGNYVYSPLGTEAIKRELLAGRGVTIAYHSDMSMDPDAIRNMYHDSLAELGFDEEDIQLYLSAAFDHTSLTPEQKFRVWRLIMLVSGYSEEQVTQEAFLAYQQEQRAALARAEEEKNQQNADDEAEKEKEQKALSEEQQAVLKTKSRRAAEALGMDYEEYVNYFVHMLEARETHYINTDTYAQYTDNIYAPVSHAVCIVGWDDNYSASNFLPDHRPPADGAWIVRNSWGENYGNDGYFYLSYYDQTISVPETFEFIVSDIDSHTSTAEIQTHDMMPIKQIDSAELEQPVYTANVFSSITYDCLLSEISMMTADLDSTVTASVFLLDEDAVSPTDGVMLDAVTASFPYAGYHRVSLNHNYFIPAGSRVSVVQLQRKQTADGERFVVPYGTGSNEKLTLTINILSAPFGEDYQSHSYFVGKIGRGESFVLLDGEWMDWADVISTLTETYSAPTFLAYDNLSMKIYLYPADETETLHRFSVPVRYHGSSIRVCTDCGYTIIQES